MSESTAIIILLASFLIMVFLRFPIAYSVAISTLLCLSYMGLPLATLTQQMVKGISSFSLMAVPFFITMGVLMGSGGISEKLLNLADACVGWMTGGLAGGCLRRLDDRRTGNGQHRCFLFLRRHLRFRVC